MDKRVPHRDYMEPYTTVLPNFKDFSQSGKTTIIILAGRRCTVYPKKFRRIPTEYRKILLSESHFTTFLGTFVK